MKRQYRRTALAWIAAMAAVCLGGCGSSQTASSAADRENAARAEKEAETRLMAEAALGGRAEVLAHGDLARNGLEQILAVNRLKGAPQAGSGPQASMPILITRAAVIEKEGGKWTEVLRCDERLKNPVGYLGGSPAGRVSGWQLQFDPNTEQGLEMSFTPADADSGPRASGGDDPPGRTVVVRWNTRVKRYQSLDQSHERYLNEIPTLETPQSILR
jgi:hypothetical protein